MRRTTALLSVLAIAWAVLFTVQTAHAATSASSMRWGGSSAGNAALSWAERNATGCWYRYGGTGPCGAGYDCSGLVVTAFAHEGISLPRTTFAMLGSRHLHWIPASEARRGDLAFYGSGHVEITSAWPGITFGAHDTGSRVGWIREWMTPTFYRVY